MNEISGNNSFAEAPLVDYTVINENIRNGIYTEDFLIILINAFKNDAKKNIQTLYTSIEKNDHQMFNDGLHALSGAAGNINARRLALLCRKSQNISFDENFNKNAEKILSQIKVCLGETENALDNLVVT